MPKLPTAQEVYGTRQAPRVQASIQGYDTSAISNAAQRMGATIEDAGNTMTRTGVEAIERDRAAQEQELKARKEMQDRKDRLLDAQMRSEILRSSIDFENQIADRTDVENFGTDATKLIDGIKAKHKGSFSPDAQIDADLWTGDFLAKQMGSINGKVREKRNTAALASAEQTRADNFKAMELSPDDGRFAQLASATLEIDANLRNLGLIDDIEYGRRTRALEAETGRIYASRLSPEKLVELTNRAVNGTSGSYIDKLTAIESGGNPAAKNPNSTAKGLYQWVDGTAREYGLLGDGFDYRGDPEKEKAALEKFTADNKAYLTKKLGREPTDGELYLAHQQGRVGAAKLLTNPSENAVSLVGRDSIINNDGTVIQTAGQFAQKWVEKFDGATGKTGTPLDLLSMDDLKKYNMSAVGNMATEVIENNPEQFLSEIDGDRYKSLTPTQRTNFINVANAAIKKKQEAADFAVLQKNTEQYRELIDKDANETLTYSEVMNFMADAGEDQNKLKVGKALLNKMEKPVNLTDKDPIEIASIQQNLTARFDELMVKKKGVYKPADGLSEFAKFQADYIENSQYLSKEQRVKFAAIMPVIEAKIKGIDPSAGWFSRGDTIANDELVDSYDAIDSFLSAKGNEAINTPETRLELFASIAPTIQATKEAGGLKEGQEYSAAAKITETFIKKKFPQFNNFKAGEFPTLIYDDAGNSVAVPPELTKTGVKSVAVNKVSAPFKLQASYTLKDGTTITSDRILDSAKNNGITPERVIELMRQSGKL
jgi:hypothetical protein